MASFSCAAGQPVHVVYASNPKEYVAMIASMTSALHNSYHPHRLRFHLIFPAEQEAAGLCGVVRKALAKFPSMLCHTNRHLLDSEDSYRECPTAGNSKRLTGGGSRATCFCKSPQFELVPFHEHDYPMIRQTTSSSLDRTELLTGVNFARNFMDDLLLPHGINRAIYLDVDTIVQGDLVNLWSTHFQEGKLFAAANSCYLHMSYWFDFDVDVVKNTLNKKDCYINAGVYIVDLLQYKERRIQSTIASLVAQHRHHKIWKVGVHQSSFILALYNYTQLLDPRWNLVQLGWNKELKSAKLNEAFVLHWNGEKKPWLNDGLYKDRWRPFSSDVFIR